MKLIETIENKAKELGIRVVWAYKLDQYTPPSASTKYNCIVMNANWHNQNELAFQLAHEIVHILNHDDCISFYHASFNSKERIEREANIGAIELLIPIFYDMGYSRNPVVFMEVFHAPAYLHDTVVKLMKNIEE